MTKTIEAVALAYKKENSPNKKVKIPAIRHLLENKKTITEVSEILFKAYNTIKSWCVHWRMIIRQGGNTSQDTPKDDTVEGRSYLVHNDMACSHGTR